jgi:hypothetical protein
MYLCAMVYERTLGKWSLWATHPNRLGGIAELFTTEAYADARASDLRKMGYRVETFLSRPEKQAMPVAAARLALLRHR